MAKAILEGGPAIPKISVVIPAFNCEKYIEQTLDSIKNQTVQPHEVVMVNDCSTDNTYKTAFNWSIKNRYTISFRRNDVNRGIGYTRNIGVTYCSGDYITFLSADDCWRPNFLEQATQLLDENTVVFSDYYQCDQHLKPYNIFKAPVNNVEKEIVKFALEKNMFINFSCTVFPKKVFSKSTFQDDLRHGEDLIFLLDVLISGLTFKHVVQPLLYYRIHPQQGSNLHLTTEWQQLWLYIKTRLLLLDVPEQTIDKAMEKNYKVLYPPQDFTYTTKRFLSKALSKNKYGLALKQTLKRK